MNIILSLVVTSMLVAFPLLVGQTKENSSVSIRELRNAPTTIVIDNRSLHLSAGASRDFSPGPPRPDASALMVGVKVTAADQKSIPKGVRMDRVWVLFGEEVWEVPIRGRIIGQDTWINWMNCGDKPVCEISISNGPKWAPGVYVDVVVRLTDSEGKSHLLQAPNQRVLSTS